MTRDQFAALLLEIQEKERAVREAGQKEYAHDTDNCFANFDSDADHGVSRLQSIMTHLNKHYRGIRAFVNGHRSQREDIRGRIKDARLYLALLWAAIEDEALSQALSNDAHSDGWLYGADPLDELSRQMTVPELSKERDGHRQLPGPRYSDIVVPGAGHIKMFPDPDSANR